MPIGISYYGNKRPAQGVKPHRTVTVPDNARKDLLPFGKPNPIDLMTGKHMVQFKPDAAVAASVEVADSVVRSESDDKIRLDGDAAAPGNDKLYGTDGTGAKGWRDAPSSAPNGVAAGDVQFFNGTTWVNSSVGTPSSGDLLKWDGSKYVKVTPTQVTVVTAWRMDKTNHKFQVKTRTGYVLSPGAESAWTDISDADGGVLDEGVIP